MLGRRSFLLVATTARRRLVATTSSERTLVTRRRRQLVPKTTPKRPPMPNTTASNDSKNYDNFKFNEPFAPAEETMSEYFKKTTLSPWVPLPDTAARELFDMVRHSRSLYKVSNNKDNNDEDSDKSKEFVFGSNIFADRSADDDDDELQDYTSDDLTLLHHVDLGCGDGRVCFHALDYGQVASSLGVDVDAAILERAQTRRAKRHPAPQNLQFVQADLMSPGSIDSSIDDDNIWNKVANADVITMFFEDDGLTQIRPLLEKHLIGKQCRIITCGYAMPGWVSTFEKVVLGTTLYMYHWGLPEIDRNRSIVVNKGVSDFPFGDDTMMPDGSQQVTTQKERFFQGYKVVDRTQDALRDRYKREMEEDDNSEFTDDEDNEGRNDKTNEKSASKGDKLNKKDLDDLIITKYLNKK